MTHRPHIPARPTTYKGIKMRSRLEATVAGVIDGWGATWSYEPMCFAAGSTQYLPDFLLTGGVRNMYIEVKPYLDDPEPLKRRMETIWASEPDALLAVWLPDDPPLIGRDGRWLDADEIDRVTS